MAASSNPGIRIQCVTVDAHEPGPLARFWAAALGWRVTFEDDVETVIEPPEGSLANDVAPDILFIKVTDEKVVKGRMHFDLRPDDQQVQVERLMALGATHADIGQGDEVPWVVLADPEGNEFCVLSPLPDA